MKLGLQISSFSWPGGDAAIGPTLARIARTADEAGFDSIWVMDHFFQIRSIGRPEEPMLEGFTTLGHLAAITSRARLELMVDGIHYRQTGLWLKATTTLDVLSGGRAWFGIGAAWNEEESKALGFPMPRLSVRFELLALARACGRVHPALVPLDALELLDVDLRSVRVDELFGYEPGWGLPSDADVANITDLMTRAERGAST